MVSAATEPHTEDLHRQLAADWQVYASRGWTAHAIQPHTEFWKGRIEKLQDRMAPSGEPLLLEGLEQFRRNFQVIGDNPRSDPASWNPALRLKPQHRGEREVLRRCHRILEEHGYTELLERHPTPDVGNPYVFEFRGCRYTHRWFKHVYMLGLLRRTLGERLPEDFIELDIGSSYGIFPALLKREWPRSRHVLVDFPAQLVYARYFLSRYLPGSRIAAAEEVAAADSIGREWIEQFDFVLLPSGAYQKLAAGSVDLNVNFASLGEMTRRWFDYYVQAPAFRTARWWITANPVDGSELFGSEISVLDYGLGDPSRKIHFGICPAFFHPYATARRRGLFGYALRPFPPFFEYVGSIQG